jgi:adenylate cyclase
VAVVTPAALAAAREILARVEALNATETAAGNPALGLDIALHAGDVTYGNIGTADRLDFTVIGPAVNEAARLEGLCKVLGKPILISKAFVQAAEAVREPLLSVGRHPLRACAKHRKYSPFTLEGSDTSPRSPRLAECNSASTQKPSATTQSRQAPLTLSILHLRSRDDP